MTLDIKILGPGCANCYRLEGLAVAAVQFLQSQKPELFQDIEVTLDHLSTPAIFAGMAFCARLASSSTKNSLSQDVCRPC